MTDDDPGDLIKNASRLTGEITAPDECELLFGESVVMHDVFATIEKLAPLPLNVLIQGETGTGKEVAARIIHERSTRKRQPFVILDCTALDANYVEAYATLFGVKAGPIIGAEDDRPGLLEIADGGTLFVDEIDALPPLLQHRLSRALDRGGVMPLGEFCKLRHVDVRVVAATTQDLWTELRAGRFRADLIAQVASDILHLPPLRDRRIDVAGLAERFLADLMLPNSVILAEDAKAAIASYDWPGNVRELKKVILHAAVLCGNTLIRAEHLRLGRRLEAD